MAGNVQDKMTFAFTKQDVTITHPSGVTSTNTKAQVQRWMDHIDARIVELTAQKAQIKTSMLDKITNAVVAEL